MNETMNRRARRALARKQGIKWEDIQKAKRNALMQDDPQYRAPKTTGSLSGRVAEVPVHVVQARTDEEAKAVVAEVAAQVDVRGTSIQGGRGTCATCGKREKVRKDGTMCTHRAHAGDPECAGSGQEAL